MPTRYIRFEIRDCCVIKSSVAYAGVLCESEIQRDSKSDVLLSAKKKDDNALLKSNSIPLHNQEERFGRVFGPRKSNKKRWRVPRTYLAELFGQNHLGAQIGARFVSMCVSRASVVHFEDPRNLQILLRVQWRTSQKLQIDAWSNGFNLELWRGTICWLSAVSSRITTYAVR